MNTSGKRAFITGLYGQDGSYLAEHLLSKGYEVLGLITESDTQHSNAQLFRGVQGVSTHIGTLENLSTYRDVLAEYAPDEVYNLAALSDLTTAGENPERTMQINAWALRDVAEIVYAVGPDAHIFQALSSRMLTAHADGSIDEKSPFANGEHPYDVSKKISYDKVVLPYRAKGFYIASGFLCNHESPRRGNRFVTGKIVEQVVLIAKGKAETLSMGNVDAKRDWSYAGDFVRAMHAILALPEPSDFVIGSGAVKSVRDFVTEAFKAIDMELVWEGEGVDTKACDTSGNIRVMVDPAFYKADDNPVVSNTTKLEQATEWQRTVTFEELVQMMVEEELKKLTR